MNNIDLNTCVPGQQLKLRNGDIVTYSDKFIRNDFTKYSHLVRNKKTGREWYADDGSYLKSAPEHPFDIIEILPMNTPDETNNKIDLNKCVPGQQLRRRDGVIVEYVKAEGHKYKPHAVGTKENHYYVATNGYLVDHGLECVCDIVEILPLPVNKSPTENTTFDELSRRIDVMQAFKQGKPIEVRQRAFGCTWTDAPLPCWDWPSFDYRIKQTPRVKWFVEDFGNLHLIADDKVEGTKLTGHKLVKFMEVME